MSLSHSPSGSVGSKKTIFQKLFGKVKGAIMALGILSTPAIAQASNTHASETKLPPIEERLAAAQKMNLEGMKSIQELEETIERTWSQLKDTPKAPEEIRDKYGHITTKGLMWIESELPAEYLRKAQKYKNMERKIAEMDKKDPKYGAWEYSLICLGALMIGILGFKFGKVSKKELEKLKNESKIAHDQAISAKNETAELKVKLEELQKAQKTGWKNGKMVDAEIVEPLHAPDDTVQETPIQEVPEWAKDTFLAEGSYTEIRDILITDLSSDTPSKEAQDLKESIQKISDLSDENREKAQLMGVMSEKFISYARFKKIPEDILEKLLRALEKSFQGQELYFGRVPVIGQPIDITNMVRVGEVTTGATIKVTKILSLSVMGPNTHPQATTKTRTYELAKVNC